VKVQEVAVEVRLWATQAENRLLRIPVAERGVIVADHPESEDGSPMLLVDGRPYPPWSEDAVAAVLLVLSGPTEEETELLRAAADAGYCIEPRVVSQPWRDIERLDTQSEN
jgi:hypothetical protein